MAPTVIHYPEDQLICFELEPLETWARSEFPHPLVTVDFNAGDQVIAVTFVGRAAQVAREQGLAAAVREVRERPGRIIVHQEGVEPLDPEGLTALEAWAEANADMLAAAVANVQERHGERV